MRYLFLFVFILLISLYPFITASRLVGKRTRNIIFGAIYGAYLIYLGTCYFHAQDEPLFVTAVTGTIVLVIPLLVATLLFLIEDVLKLIYTAVKALVKGISFRKAYPRRKNWFVVVPYVLSFAVFYLFIKGTTSWRYNFKVREEVIYTDRLPAGLDSLRIVHLSDMHLGSFPETAPLATAFALANELDPDLLFFTGDLVNYDASEIAPWMDVLSTWTARYGVFATMGNHDYGDYILWDSEEEKEKNLASFPGIYAATGARLLNNEHAAVVINGDTVWVVGVENWGTGPFTQAGDLNKATEGIPENAFMLLLSHDPDHFTEVVADYHKPVFLTFAGHTHGMQLGFEFSDKLRWSPAQYFYRKWAGLYEENDRLLYVNRGLGYHGYHGRIGIWPEITLIRILRSPARIGENNP